MGFEKIFGNFLYMYFSFNPDFSVEIIILAYVITIHINSLNFYNTRVAIALFTVNFFTLPDFSSLFFYIIFLFNYVLWLFVQRQEAPSNIFTD